MYELSVVSWHCTWGAKLTNIQECIKKLSLLLFYERKSPFVQMIKFFSRLMSFQKINRFLREIWFKRKWTRKNKSLFLWELFCFFLTRKTVKKKAGWKHQPRLLIPPKLTLSKYYCYYCVQNTCCLPNKKAFPTSFFSFRINL